MATETERAFSGTAGPDGLQIDTNGRKNGDVQDGEEALREFFGLLKFERDPTEAEVQHTGAASALLANDGVGIRTNHGNAFGLSLNRVGSRSFGGRRSLRGDGTRGEGRSTGEIGWGFFTWPPGDDGNGRGRRRRWNDRGLDRRLH